jgi:hypothetical protein
LPELTFSLNRLNIIIVQSHDEVAKPVSSSNQVIFLTGPEEMKQNSGGDSAV